MFKINWDGLGIAASVACAIHCAVLPLLFTSLPLLGVNIIHNPLFEWFMIVLSFGIGTQALWHGYRLHHHKKLPYALFGIGFIFLVAKEFLPTWHTKMVVVAVLFIVAAHIFNYRLCRKANHCHVDDCDH